MESKIREWVKGNKKDSERKVRKGEQKRSGKGNKKYPDRVEKIEEKNLSISL